MKTNPFLLPQQDPYEGFYLQKKQIDELQTEFERLCFEIFIVGKDGQALAKTIHQRYLLPSHVTPTDANADRLYVWWDGFKAALRGLVENGLKHQSRIAQGVKR